VHRTTDSCEVQEVAGIRNPEPPAGERNRRAAREIKSLRQGAVIKEQERLRHDEPRVSGSISSTSSSGKGTKAEKQTMIGKGARWEGATGRVNVDMRTSSAGSRAVLASVASMRWHSGRARQMKGRRSHAAVTARPYRRQSSHGRIIAPRFWPLLLPTECVARPAQVHRGFPLVANINKTESQRRSRRTGLSSGRTRRKIEAK